MEILIKASQLVLSLSILILIHEFGHFIFARMFKVRVEKFYLFFDIKFALFKHKPRNSETEYGIGWLPLGGYCKIAGMIDESMDTETLKSEPQPWEFRSKPAYQRLLIMLGGVLFNVILAFFIYVGMLAYWGEEYLANKDVKYGILCDSVAMEMGFRDGDKILAVNGEPVKAFFDIHRKMALHRAMNISLQRGDEVVNISPDYYTYISYMVKNHFIEPYIPFVINSVPDSSLNRFTGLKAGDEIIGVNEIMTNNIKEIRKLFAENKGKEIKLKIRRDIIQIYITVQVNNDGMIGVELKNNMRDFFDFEKKSYTILQAFPAGLKKAKTRLFDQLCELRLMITPKTKTYKQVGSFISIGNIYSAQWDWHRFCDITALLSIMLAVLNLLPIPALDGGHVMFLLYEAITRRKPSDKFLTYAQVVGMVILLFIMVYAIGNDIVRHILN
ncbi:MAG: RIP metalloprotease RseP [Prevotellaceae bacterium]|jgi:regulator of sigma E protease|nr:RIP metalloprotease RseP [Prevotellaceae bacterium]